MKTQYSGQFFYKQLPVTYKNSESSTVFYVYTSKNAVDKNVSRSANTLLSDFKFNNQVVLYNGRLLSFLSTTFFGVNSFFIKKAAERIEVGVNHSYNSYNMEKWLVFGAFLSKIVPANKSIKDKLLLNLSFLFLIRSYRGWRHSFNLPVRGQRTWSNARSTIKSKNYLREYMFNCFKSGITQAHSDEVKNAFYLEQLNSLWKWQWEREWMIAFKKRRVQLKKTKGVKKLELSTLAKTNPNFIKVKKQVIIPIGFEAGFTKNYLKDLKQQVLKKK